jgi:hypothetical protein
MQKSKVSLELFYDGENWDWRINIKFPKHPKAGLEIYGLSPEHCFRRLAKVIEDRNVHFCGYSVPYAGGVPL